MSIRTKPIVKSIVGLIAGTVLIALSMTAAAHPGFAPHSHEAGFWNGFAHPFGWLGSLAALITLGVGVYVAAARLSKKSGHEYQRQDDQPGKQR